MNSCCVPYKKITNNQEKKVKTMYSRGMTGSEIAVRLDVSMKQVYGSLRRQGVPRKTLWEQNKILFEKKPVTFHWKSKISKRDRELLIAAVMLFCGEGAKTGVTVDFANADVRTVKLFLKFLRTICGIDERRLRLYLYCFSNQNVQSLIRFWSTQLNAESSQFTKPYVRPALNRGERIVPYGVIHVRYSDKKLLQKILSLCKTLVETI